MRTSILYLVIAWTVLVIVHGCTGAIFPVADLGDGNPQTLGQPVIIEPERVYPREAEIGTEIVIQGAGDTFPAGFYRFVFTGGAQVETVQDSPTSLLKVKIPGGARSGPFGFIVGGRPQNGLEIGDPSPDGFVTYTVRDPGIRIIDSDPWVP